MSWLLIGQSTEKNITLIYFVLNMSYKPQNREKHQHKTRIRSFRMLWVFYLDPIV